MAWYFLRIKRELMEDRRHNNADARNILFPFDLESLVVRTEIDRSGVATNLAADRTAAELVRDRRT